MTETQEMMQHLHSESDTNENNQSPTNDADSSEASESENGSADQNDGGANEEDGGEASSTSGESDSEDEEEEEEGNMDLMLAMLRLIQKKNIGSKRKASGSAARGKEAARGKQQLLSLVSRALGDLNAPDCLEPLRTPEPPPTKRVKPTISSDSNRKKTRSRKNASQVGETKPLPPLRQHHPSDESVLQAFTGIAPEPQGEQALFGAGPDSHRNKTVEYAAEYSEHMRQPKAHVSRVMEEDEMSSGSVDSMAASAAAAAAAALAMGAHKRNASVMESEEAEGSSRSIGSGGACGNQQRMEFEPLKLSEPSRQHQVAREFQQLPQQQQQPQLLALSCQNPKQQTQQQQCVQQYTKPALLSLPLACGITASSSPCGPIFPQRQPPLREPTLQASPSAASASPGAASASLLAAPLRPLGFPEPTPAPLPPCRQENFLDRLEAAGNEGLAERPLGFLHPGFGAAEDAEVDGSGGFVGVGMEADVAGDDVDEWMPRTHRRSKEGEQQGGAGGSRIKARSMAERQRRERISEGLQKLRLAVRGHGDTATMLDNAVAYVQQMQRRLTSLETSMLLHQAQCGGMLQQGSAAAAAGTLASRGRGLNAKRFLSPSLFSLDM